MSTQLGRVLRQIRQDRGLTQREVANLAGIDRPTIYLIETGQRTNVEIATLQQFVQRMQLRKREIEQLGLALLAPHGMDRIRRPRAVIAKRGHEDKEYGTR